MVARHAEAKRDPLVASRLILSLAGVSDPSVDQEAGALLVAEFGLKVISALSGKA